MPYRITLLPGDGIGPEVVRSARTVLEAIAEQQHLSFCFTEAAIGGNALDRFGMPLPDTTLKACLDSDAVLLGAVGGPEWETCPPGLRPEAALLALRSAMGVYANLRPARLEPALSACCMLRQDVAEHGIDLVVVRELTGGMYFGKRERILMPDGPVAYDTEQYSRTEIERIARTAFRTALTRRGKVTSVDKANVLETSRLWRETVHRIAAEEFPEVLLEDMLVDNCAMQLIRNPSAFDVILTSNLFGDILSDEASQLTGSIGLLPSASLGDGTRGLYEPIHGSAPDLAGKNIANPLATILSAAMLLRHSLHLPDAADTIEHAVSTALADGCRTADLMYSGMPPLSCTSMTDAVIARL